MWFFSLFPRNISCESKMWKNEKFSHTEKIFREIKSLVTFFCETAASRNFCQKSVRHTLEITEFYCHAHMCAQCGKVL